MEKTCKKCDKRPAGSNKPGWCAECLREAGLCPLCGENPAAPSLSFSPKNKIDLNAGPCWSCRASGANTFKQIYGSFPRRF